jgi:hypothetical protein
VIAGGELASADVDLVAMVASADAIDGDELGAADVAFAASNAATDALAGRASSAPRRATSARGRARVTGLRSQAEAR